MPLRSDKTTWFGVVLAAPDETSGYNLACQYEEHHVRPVWPGAAGEQQMQLHLDLQVDDLGEAAAYAVECGAELAAFQPQERVRVLLDPAGHPFCLYL